tara:strand:- start:2348 stop:3046 length:699 start_codon:yes stop_codon:yes gene_type:complete
MNNINKKPNSLISLINIMRTYKQGDNEIKVLNKINIEIHKGEIVSLLGNSGTGKSSLLHIAGLLENPDEGEIILDGIKYSKMSEKQRTKNRRDVIGFVYQFHHLLSDFSAIDNIIIPLLIAGHTKMTATQRAKSLLEELGLFNRKDHLPSQLSGGEQQRVAIARAIANKPKILLADEPTGNLDSKTAENVFNQFISLARNHDMSVLFATHNIKLSELSDRKINLVDGSLIED